MLSPISSVSSLRSHIPARIGWHRREMNAKFCAEASSEMATRETKLETGYETEMDMYISRLTRRTNSYNVSLFIIKCSTCFGLFGSSSEATFWSCISQLVYAGTSGCCVDIATQQPDVWYWL